MAKRSTPLRGSATVRSPDHPAELGRSTLQELSALDAMATVAEAQEQVHQRFRSEPARKSAWRPPAPLPAKHEALRGQPLEPAEGSTRSMTAPPPALQRLSDLDDPALSEYPTLRAPFDAPPPAAALRESVPQRSLVLSGAPQEVALAADDPDRLPQGPVHAAPPLSWASPLKSGGPGDLRLVLQREPDSERAAAFRVLRHRIEQQNPDHMGTRVIALCAPRPRQGSTTAVANLALALCECDRARVCILEGNLRRPSLAQLFRFKPPMCLAERLERDRREPLEPWCVAELTPSLHVLAVREGAPRRPLVDGPAFAAAVEAMRRAGYRYVLVDGPEVLGIADMNLIEESVDEVLLVARGGQTTATDLRAAAAQLSGSKLRGVILLDAE
ncbi:MAG: CpsD/CapB family tyrosine-protein kinase [Myxococcales bacterium]|nr:CpsD/CapB family tyrosine-protein kinase [Myxococcota bacterium]MDW8283309.1 CpsD/CapB family tyrosine-protein kinase [Myxococcales bacterium]